MQQAIFGAGCFWGVQYYFDQIPGVMETTVGYTGGHVPNPTYEQVCTQTTGHIEVVHMTFDPEEVSYEVLLKHFFRMHDPTQLNRQGPDVGESYRSAIFYYDEAQRDAIERVRNAIQDQYDKPIVTLILQATDFYRAEEYHQKYTEKTGLGMCHVPYTPIS